MNTIWKYNLTKQSISVQVPKDAKIICVQVQNNTSTLWMLVNTDNELEERFFVQYETGEKIIDDLDKLVYIGTCLLSKGLYVVHIFERIKIVIR